MFANVFAKLDGRKRKKEEECGWLKRVNLCKSMNSINLQRLSSAQDWICNYLIFN